MTPIRHDAVMNWARPWPISFAIKRAAPKWVISLRTVEDCLSSFSVYWTHKDRPVKARVAAKNLRKYWPREHHIAQGIRHQGSLRQPVILVFNSRIVDGNHRLMALASSGKKDRSQYVLVFEANTRRRGK